MIGSRRTSILPSRFSRLDRSFSKITISPNNRHKTIESTILLNSSSQRQITHEELRLLAPPQKTRTPSQWWNRWKNRCFSTKILLQDRVQHQVAYTKILTTTICWISQRIQIRKNAHSTQKKVKINLTRSWNLLLWSRQPHATAALRQCLMFMRQLQIKTQILFPQSISSSVSSLLEPQTGDHKPIPI